MKVYVLKGWHTNTVYKDQGNWVNHKVTLSEMASRATFKRV